MESTFCVDCLQEALRKYWTPEIFNTDQGAQFTSATFIGELKEHPTISYQHGWTWQGTGQHLCRTALEECQT